MVAKMLRRAVSYATLFEEQNLERMLLRATVAFRCMDHSSMMTIFSLCIDSVFQNSLTCRHKTYFHQFFLNSEVCSKYPFSTLFSHIIYLFNYIFVCFCFCFGFLVCYLWYYCLGIGFGAKLVEVHLLSSPSGYMLITFGFPLLFEVYS